MMSPEQLVDRIERELYDQFPAADPTDLDAAVTGFRSAFGIEAPAELVQLWRRSDGLDADGMVLFATRDRNLDQDEQRLGVLESNERLLHGVKDSDSSLRFIGQHESVLLAFDTADGLWKVVDEIDWTPDDQYDDVFDTFWEMITDRADLILDEA